MTDQVRHGIYHCWEHHIYCVIRRRTYTHLATLLRIYGLRADAIVKIS